MPKTKSSQIQIPSAKADTQPATRKMLALVRTEVIQRMDSGFNRMESKFNTLEASHARMELLLEEQNANNRIVLEGLQTVWQRQDRLEERIR